VPWRTRGEKYLHRPDDLIDELNGEKRPDVIVELSRKIQLEKNNFSKP